MILYSAGEQRIKDSQEAKREALRLVRVVAASQHWLVDSARHLLVALSLLREVRSQDGDACSALFATLLKEYPFYVNFGAADINGKQYCSALPKYNRVSIAGRSYFRLAVQRKSLVVGDYQVGRVTGKASLNLGYPIFDSYGTVVGVVFAALDLAPLRQNCRHRQFAQLYHSRHL